MFNQDIQDVVDARLKSVRDNYMDEGAMKALRDDLLHETRAELVEAVVLPGTRTLHAKVHVMGDCYESRIELSQDVPHLNLETVPAHVEVGRDDLNAPHRSDEEMAEIAAEHQQQKLDEQNAAHEEQLQSQAEQTKSEDQGHDSHE